MAGSPHRFLYLLASQLSLMVLFPFIADDHPRPSVGAVFIILVYVAAVWTVAGERRTRLVATVLLVPAVVTLLVSVPVANRVSVPAVVFGIVFFAFMTAVTFRGVLTSAVVTTETLYGAMTAYLFVGLTWAWVYALVEQLHPGSFRATMNGDGIVAGRDFTFFSFITLTSVGYGDIIPLTGHAKSLAMLEAVTGQMYLAIFIARLVGLHGQRAPDAE